MRQDSYHVDILYNCRRFKFCIIHFSEVHACVWVGGWELAGENNLDLLLTQWQIFSCGLEGTHQTPEASWLTPWPIPSQPHWPSSGCTRRLLPSALRSCYSSLLGRLLLPSPHPICTLTLWLTNSYPSLRSVTSSDHSNCGAMEGLGTPTMEPQIFTLEFPCDYFLLPRAALSYILYLFYSALW